jgi:Glycosyltransferase family 87
MIEKEMCIRPRAGGFRGLLGPAPGLREWVVICWTVFAAFVILPLIVVVSLQMRAGSFSIRGLHADFVYVYGVGQMVRDYPADRLYDVALQQRVFDRISPAHLGSYGPSPYPPFVALFFRCFAGLPYATAYLVWAALSLLLYLLGLRAALVSLYPREPLQQSLFFCFALAFYPFLFATLINGQLSSVAVFAIGLALYAERQEQLWWSGLALSLLCYKPTLLVLLLPMLLLTRRWKPLLGFAAGGALLCALATAFEGIRIWPAYAHLLGSFGHAAGWGGRSAMEVAKYIDAHSISLAIPGGTSWVGITILLIVLSAAGAALAVLLFRSARGGKPVQNLVWAATLTWTLLLNVYVPVYDAVLVTLALMLTLCAVRQMRQRAATGWIVLLAVLILLSSWSAVPLAAAHGVQMMSGLLALLGGAQLFLLRQALSHPRSAATAAGM